MNLSSYIDTIHRTGQNLPGIFLEWTELPDDLRSHYCDSLIELIATHPDARSAVRTGEDRVRLDEVWDALVGVLVNHASLIAAFMGLNILDLLAPQNITPSSTDDYRSDTVGIEDAEELIAA